jgi:glycosyltransferase involved in cell wall biosynthesis
MRAVPAPYPPGASTHERVRALRALLRAERIDVLHIHSPSVGGQTVPMLAARLAGAAANVVTYHQIQARRLGVRSRVVNHVTHTVLVDGTIAVSTGVLETLVAASGLPRRRMQVIHNGIEPQKYAPGERMFPVREAGEVRIGYFGRLSHEKGVSSLLHGLAKLIPSHPQVRMLIVGDGPERSQLEAATAALGLTNSVHFLGFRTDARRIMAEVDILAHVPVYEGFGLVVLEAMAAGLPVVTNDAPGGPSEIVLHGETGLVVPHGSARALADALAGLIADPAERDRLGRNGQIRCAEQFSASVMARRTVDLYERLLGRHRFRRRPVLDHFAARGG